jgi:lipopolysaccharide assembly outer membrane protein LptD (OstA)
LQAQHKTEPLRLKFTINFLVTCFLFSLGHSAMAQQVIAPAAPGDSIRIIRIIQTKTLRQKNIDSATLIETVAGDVIMKEGLTTFYCDSATINRKTNIMEAFGNIHINDNDSIPMHSTCVM